MTSPLHKLEGLTITEVLEIQDYIQLHFGDDIGISIYNEMEISPRTLTVSKLVGKTVTAVTEREEAIEIKLLDGSQIIVDMHRQAYRGPEALEMNQHGHPPVIWN